MDKVEQNKQIKDLRIELIGESFDTFIKGLEKNFEEYLQTWEDVFKEYRGKASIKHVKERIPGNNWLRLQKEALSDPQVQAHYDELTSDTKEREIVRQELDRAVDRRMKKLDIV